MSGITRWLHLAFVIAVSIWDLHDVFAVQSLLLDSLLQVSSSRLRVSHAPASMAAHRVLQVAGRQTPQDAAVTR